MMTDGIEKGRAYQKEPSAGRGYDVRIYEPDASLKMGIRIWPLMVKELVTGRELIWRLFVRDLLARYKQSVLGSLWAGIMPFLAIGIFVFLNRAGVMNISRTDVAYPLFALIGITVWQLFATGLNSGTQSLVASGSMISKINFPLEALVFSSMAQAVFEFLIKSALILMFFVLYRFVPPFSALLFPLALIPIFFLTVGFSFVLALVNGVLRDVGSMVPLVTTFLMFATPVLYPADPDKSMFFKWNPLNYLVNGPRDIIIYGKIQDPLGFIWSSVFALVFFFLAWRMFFIAKKKIPERI